MNTNLKLCVMMLTLCAGGMISAGDDAKTQPSPQEAPVPERPATPAASPATNAGAMKDLVADAIKRKLEKKLQEQKQGVANPTETTTVSAETLPIDLKRPVYEPSSEPMPIVPKVMPGAKVFMSPSNQAEAEALRKELFPENPRELQPKKITSEGIDADPESWLKASRPGAQHEMLDIFVGTWTVQATFDNGPDQPAETGTGTMVNSWQLQGRWMRQEYTGEMAGMGKFNGIGYLGYDNIKGHYAATWMDTLSTSSISSTGSFDANSATFTLTAKLPSPGSGADQFVQKQVIKVLSPDKYRVTMYIAGPDGSESKTGELEYTRAIRTFTNAEVKKN